MPAETRVGATLTALLLVGCPGSGPDDDDTVPLYDDDSSVTDDDDTAPPTGDRTVSGQAWFFDAAGIGEIVELHDVTGAEVHLLQYPTRRMEIEPDGLFAFDDLPDHSEVTVGLEHPDFYPSLTATLPIGTEDVTGITFQAVTWPIAEFLGLLVGSDPHDPNVCTMVVTVTAISDNQHSVYAPGEPDVVVSIDPPVDPARGPIYFDTSVVPDLDLAATTTDGGVIVAGVEPGAYVWTAHKDGLEFAPLALTCVGGTLTNGSPPYGLQASIPGE